MVTGILLEPDARLPRIALAMPPTATLASRQRQLIRMLDGPLDVRACYRRLLRRVLEGWYVKRVTLLLDTTSISGRVYFVRLALAHGDHALPLAWRSYVGRSATVGFETYCELLEEAESLLPPRLQWMLLADRGFQHLVLLARCQHQHGWLYRSREQGACAARSGRDERHASGCLLPDELMQEQLDERRRLRAFCRGRGLGPGECWIPPGSFEERNATWWLPGNITWYPPRMPIDDPPSIWSAGG